MTDVLSKYRTGPHCEKSIPDAPVYWNAGRVSMAVRSSAFSSCE